VVLSLDGPTSVEPCRFDAGTGGAGFADSLRSSSVMGLDNSNRKATTHADAGPEAPEQFMKTSPLEAFLILPSRPSRRIVVLDMGMSTCSWSSRAATQVSAKIRAQVSLLAQSMNAWGLPSRVIVSFEKSTHQSPMHTLASPSSSASSSAGPFEN